mgnify:CR=1 FL=1
MEAEDVVWAPRKMVVVCGRRPGPRIIHLTRRANVVDLHEGTLLGQDVASFVADFDDRATRVFVLR